MRRVLWCSPWPRDPIGKQQMAATVCFAATEHDGTRQNTTEHQRLSQPFPALLTLQESLRCCCATRRAYELTVCRQLQRRGRDKAGSRRCAVRQTAQSRRPILEGQTEKLVTLPGRRLSDTRRTFLVLPQVYCLFIMRLLCYQARDQLFPFIFSCWLWLLYILIFVPTRGISTSEWIAKEPAHPTLEQVYSDCPISLSDYCCLVRPNTTFYYFAAILLLHPAHQCRNPQWQPASTPRLRSSRRL